MQNFEVKSVTSVDCKPWFLFKHYAKRMPPVSFAFGLYKNKVLIGVCSFGRPVSYHLKYGICGKDFENIVFELNRLVVNDGLEKNVLSFFVSQCLKKLPKPLIIVSYADSSQGHNGYIYQATNFIYTGLSISHADYAVKGMEHLHNATLFEKTKRGTKDRVGQLKEMYGDLLYKVQRDRKHRYIYFLGSNTQINIFKKALKYKIEPYPKGENRRYDSSFEVKTYPIQNTLF